MSIAFWDGDGWAISSECRNQIYHDGGDQLSWGSVQWGTGPAFPGSAKGKASPKQPSDFYHIWILCLLVITQEIVINTDPSYSRNMDPDMALGSRHYQISILECSYILKVKNFDHNSILIHNPLCCNKAACLSPSCLAAQTWNNHTETILSKTLLGPLALSSYWLTFIS